MRANTRHGFTLVELIVFVGIFAITMAAFTAVFIDMSRVAVLQGSAAEVRSQSQFILQTVQYYTERSSLVDVPADTPVTTLTLRMSSSSEDPVVFALDDGALTLSTNNGAAETITSAKVSVSDLEFVKRSNPGGNDSVAVSFTLEYVTDNPGQAASHSLRTAVMRASAAEFDSDVVPPSSGSWSLGASSARWRSINDTIYFSGSDKVGINVASPAVPLQVSGGNVYIDDSGSGLILRNGSDCFLTTVTAGGVLQTASTTCP